MRNKLKNKKIKFILGDVRDRSSVDIAMNGADYVFHAAALKQVPSCEFFPYQALLTNAVGSQNVIDSAIAHNISRVVCLSTDKAVYPVNAMGITKALMEKMVQAAARNFLGRDSETVISSVRYGNVMFSRGSVIPVFVEQIMNGRPLTVTVPEMTRFLLPLPLAIELVLFAFEHAEPGDMLIRKAAACTAMDLAIAMKNIFNSELPIQIIGMRHGEKLHETLATQDELNTSEDMGDYYRCRMDTRDLNYGKYLNEGTISQVHQDYTSENTNRLSIPEVEALLMSLEEINNLLPLTTNGTGGHDQCKVTRET
jgi:UDP-glucose 4-epimerase